MREPFSPLLPAGERLLSAGEAESGVVTGPLASLFEVLAMFGWVPGLFVLGRIEGVPLRLAVVVLPPIVCFILSRSPLRRIGRPREWLGVTDRRVLLWRRPRGFRVEPRIESVSLAEIAGVELAQDAWDRRAGTHQFIIHAPNYRGARTLARVHHAEALRDAVLTATASMIPPAQDQPPTPVPQDFLPPAPPPSDYRP
jgi:hypothetical protein